MDCVRCCDHAHLDVYGACICDSMWGGVSCNMYQNIPCDARCAGGCSGPSNFDCVACSVHATFNQYGACVCDDYWHGNDCSLYDQYLDCHPLCNPNQGCTGPTANDCISCVYHSHFDYSYSCTCDLGWSGLNCITWIGTCDHRCFHGCTGPDPDDCIDCSRNAELVDGSCACLDGYGGSGCSVYTGECDPICYGCTGATFLDCKYCVDHATKDEYGNCQCDWQWSGADCLTYHYQGTCDPICEGCHGPTSSDCTACNEHAFENFMGACQCDAYWSGDDCGTYVYTGKCHELCDGECFGPSATDCVQCVPHSVRDFNGTCICEDYWTGDDCSVRLYLGTCSPKCNQIYGCTGPEAQDCVRCVDNASRDAYGHCTCDDGWINENCNFYSNSCHPKCNGCTGPDACDCMSCVDHAAENEFGYCECDKFWGSTDCSVYEAPCHPICFGCIGPNSCDCIECVDHASKVNYECVCDANWGADDCSDYLGICSPKCEADKCHGPESCDCDYCTKNAYFDDYNYCVCYEYYTGEDCTEYTGICHPICETCSGPNACDCLTCVENANMDNNEQCSCSQNWDGLACEVWVGPCDIRCNQCTGPDPCDCQECVENAEFDSDGLCVCSDNWSGYACTEWAGACDETCIGCIGPTALDCKGCVRNAFRNEWGECECDFDWRDEDCSVYAGQCDPKCNTSAGCFGPLDSDCHDCTLHATLEESTHRCLCDKDWTGDDCSKYYGKCDDLCVGCNGPDVDQCEVCRENAHRVTRTEASNDVSLTLGDCTCNVGWGGDHCEVYEGPCWRYCIEETGDDGGCYGPTEYECTECTFNAHRNDKGFCECDKDWGEGDEWGCSAYTGHCDPRCSWCHGPTNADCQECVDHTQYWGHHNLCLCIDAPSMDIDGVIEALFIPYSTDGEVLTVNNFHGLYAVFAKWSNFAYVFSEAQVIFNNLDDSGNGELSQNEFKTALLDGDEDIVAIHKWQEDTQMWGGEDCSIYFGVCHHTCHGCHGPLATDCHECNENSERNSDGECVCQAPWTGWKCADYEDCDPICDYDYTAIDRDSTTKIESQFECSGPGKGACHNCVINAHRNWSGECECDEGWDGDDCTQFDGVCNPKCLTKCEGPTAFDCLDSCNTHAMLDIDGECVCQDWWTGDDCNTYRGECAPTCRGCIGPGADECIDCVVNAYYEADGSCICKDETLGDDCSYKKHVCHPTCLVCINPESNECIECLPGFTMVNGYCIPCHPSCKTCAAANGTEATQCESCHPGFAVQSPDSDGLGECKPCNASCKTCTKPNDWTACDSCHEDSTLKVVSIDGDDGKICQCDFPKVRQDNSWTCENQCPTGTRFHSSTRLCDDQNITDDNQMYADLYFKFETPLPVFNLILDAGQDDYALETWKNAYAESCNPPTSAGARQNHGTWFNGETSYIEIFNFEMYNNFNFNMWFKTYKLDATLVSLGAEFFSGWGAYEPDTCNPDWEIHLHKGAVEFWINSCEQLVLDFHNRDDIGMTDQVVLGRAVAEDTTVQTHWKLGFVSLEAGSTSTNVVMKVNNHQIALNNSQLPYVIYRTSGMNTYLGASETNGYNFGGFIFDFLTTSRQWSDLDTAWSDDVGFPYNRAMTSPDCTEHTALIDRMTDVCLINCQFGEYVDFEGECHKCHVSCTSGCTSGEVCYECHPSCRTCVGAEIHECVDCWCDAELNGGNCCVCNNNYDMGDDGQCHFNQCAAGCDVCRDDSYCLQCSYGYDWISGACQECLERDCDIHTEKELIANATNEGREIGECREKGPRPHTGTCNCDEGDAFDNYMCRECSQGCQTCTNGVCDTCESDFILTENLGVCQPRSFSFAGCDANGSAFQTECQDSEIFVFDMTDPINSEYGAGSRLLLESWVYNFRSIFNNRTRLEYARDWEKHADRGRWFDGNDFVGEIRWADSNAQIGYYRFSFEAWINPATSGALYSYGHDHDNIKPTFFHLGLRGNRMEVEYSEGQFTHHNQQSYPRSNYFHPRRFYSSSDMDIITYNDWQLVQYSLIPDAINRNTLITYTHNIVDRDTATFDGFLLNVSEFQSESNDNGTILIGAQDRSNEIWTDEWNDVPHKQNLDLDNMYRGWIFSIHAWNYKHDTTPFFDGGMCSDQNNCGNVCTGVNTCLATCEWNEFRNSLNQCERCFDWCPFGCRSPDGLCNVPEED